MEQSTDAVPVDVSLSFKGDVKRLRLGPSDILAVRLSGTCTDPSTMMSIGASVRKLLAKGGHENQVIISDSQMDILVITSE